MSNIKKTKNEPNNEGCGSRLLQRVQGYNGKHKRMKKRFVIYTFVINQYLG